MSKKPQETEYDRYHKWFMRELSKPVEYTRLYKGIEMKMNLVDQKIRDIGYDYFSD